MPLLLTMADGRRVRAVDGEPQLVDGMLHLPGPTFPSLLEALRWAYGTDLEAEIALDGLPVEHLPGEVLETMAERLDGFGWELRSSD
jgi:hypothetical protein